MDNGFINCVAAPLLMNVIAGKWVIISVLKYANETRNPNEATWS